MWLLELPDRLHNIKALIQYRPATLFSLKNRFVGEVQVALCEFRTELLHVMQGFGRRIIIKFLNRYQAVMHFKFSLSIS
jgi:hypothetical protein